MLLTRSKEEEKALGSVHRMNEKEDKEDLLFLLPKYVKGSLGYSHAREKPVIWT